MLISQVKRTVHIKPDGIELFRWQILRGRKIVATSEHIFESPRSAKRALDRYIGIMSESCFKFSPDGGQTHEISSTVIYKGVVK
jgi:hypothetical protein